MFDRLAINIVPWKWSFTIMNYCVRRHVWIFLIMQFFISATCGNMEILSLWLVDVILYPFTVHVNCSENSDTQSNVALKSQSSSSVINNIESSSNIYPTAGSTSSGNIGALGTAGLPNYNISYVFPDSNKLTKNAKRQYESQVSVVICFNSLSLSFNTNSTSHFRTEITHEENI